MDRTELYTKDDVLPGRLNFTDQVVVLDASLMKETYRKPEYQLWYAWGGFGCNPENIGQKVFCKCLGDGESTHWRRPDFIGVLKPELVGVLPDEMKARMTAR